MRDRIAIIGGGASGSLLCLRLLKTSDPPLIHFVERNKAQLGRGVAYSSAGDQLLNVPASRMDLFEEERGEFLAYIRSKHPESSTDAFVPRRHFGDLLAARLDKAIGERPGSVILHHSNCSKIRKVDEGYQFSLDDGTNCSVRTVVLALGNAPPASLPGLLPDLFDHPAYTAVPWNADPVSKIGSDRIRRC